MSRGIAGGWSPAEGVLTWALSNALDERSSNPRFDNPTMARAWRVEGAAGWPPDAQLEPSAPAASITREAGSTGYVMLSVPEGARVLLTSTRRAYGPLGAEDPGTVRAGVRWMVARGGS